MEHDLSLEAIKKEWHGSLQAYIRGFIASLILTAASFLLVTLKALAPHYTMYLIASSAILQAIIQSLYFLHVGQEAKPRWETLVFAFMILVLLIIAIGTLWIMHDLNSRMMPD